MIDLSLATSPQDALSQPTRARLFALLGELKRPVGTAELADRLDLHPNGVRVHLDRLESAGLVARERPRQARGRPRDAWTIETGWGFASRLRRSWPLARALDAIGTARS